MPLYAVPIWAIKNDVVRFSVLEMLKRRQNLLKMQKGKEGLGCTKPLSTFVW
jgi:hypothetical protein